MLSQCSLLPPQAWNTCVFRPNTPLFTVPGLDEKEPKIVATSISVILNDLKTFQVLQMMSKA